MTDDLQFGTRDKRGNYQPTELAGTAPLFVSSPRPIALLNWLPHYFLPYNAIFFALACVWWVWIIPPVAVMQTLAWGWVLWLLAVSAVALFLWYLAFELHLYVRRAQGNRFKYNGKFPANTPSAVFWYKSQNLDNFPRGLLSGVQIWTGLQVLVLWAYANGHATCLGFAENPVWLAVLCLIVPVIHEFHFYCIHRLIHTPFLYRWVHSVHHNSVNPSPWSSLSMHPVEHLLYFSTILYHLILPSHPLIAVYQLHVAGFGAVPGHVGFDKIELTGESAFDSHACIHYLHHRYFEVNYRDGLIPIDKWTGTFHDGTRAADALMQERHARKKARMAARAARCGG